MKLEKYIAGLQKVLDEHGDLEVIYSSDDEGNRYDHVQFTPTVGFLDGDMSFHSKKNVEESPDEETYEPFVGKKPKTVCIN